MKIFANNLIDYIDKDVVFSGFIDNIRDLQYVQFIIVRDSSGKVQVTIEKNDSNKVLNDLVSTLSLESTIKVSGKLFKNDNVKLNGMEIIPKNIEVTSKSLPELPIDIKNKDAALRETRLDYRFLDLRREDNNLLFKVQTLMEYSMREYWVNNNFMEIHTPKISGASAESGAETFKLDYFGTPACLSQSPQFYKQMALASGFDKVFEIGPAFRAENSHTSYHAAEINMIDVELAWIDSEEDVMDHEEALLKYTFSKINDKYREDIKKVFNIEIDNYDVKFPRITFSDAKKIIREKYGYEAENKLDFERKEEELICKYAKDEYKSDFVFITKYPYSARPFYHMLDENGLTKSFDLLYRGLEITTGSQREHRIDILETQAKEKGINIKSLQFYLDFFKYGCPPHGGFAIGSARLLMQIFGIDNIREATLIYRGPTRLNP
ncbi:MAG: aspartate--tRNA(Asn) ligase [Bacilli bacterium]|nr:aspartate--tRNA(Asn) ligase [Bacilli bacterium]